MQFKKNSVYNLCFFQSYLDHEQGGQFALSNRRGPNMVSKIKEAVNFMRNHRLEVFYFAYFLFVGCIVYCMGNVWRKQKYRWQPHFFLFIVCIFFLFYGEVHEGKKYKSLLQTKSAIFNFLGTLKGNKLQIMTTQLQTQSATFNFMKKHLRNWYKSDTLPQGIRSRPHYHKESDHDHTITRNQIMTTLPQGIKSWPQLIIDSELTSVPLHTRFEVKDIDLT